MYINYTRKSYVYTKRMRAWYEQYRAENHYRDRTYTAAQQTGGKKWRQMLTTFRSVTREKDFSSKLNLHTPRNERFPSRHRSQQIEKEMKNEKKIHSPRSSENKVPRRPRGRHGRPLAHHDGSSIMMIPDVRHSSSKSRHFLPPEAPEAPAAAAASFFAAAACCFCRITSASRSLRALAVRPSSRFFLAASWVFLRFLALANSL